MAAARGLGPLTNTTTSPPSHTAQWSLPAADPISHWSLSPGQITSSTRPVTGLYPTAVPMLVRHHAVPPAATPDAATSEDNDRGARPGPVRRGRDGRP
ncbi:hypothetical protein E2562_031013 [Oryza meyeriana var. granulata]|uniref:Uncharacterized protein n=1 Tax=Oryza meyeriana var. granulata TaxID=110450 RepID=A0A6G1ERJ8_9ORYZ|nr:hypothetical protein E2562_031013 [Oryza meyeriana var. granulata]